MLGDLRAQPAACTTAELGMGALVARHGPAAIRTLIAATMDYSERLTRLALSTLADGGASFTDWIDDDQVAREKPIPLVCTVRKKLDETSTGPDLALR